MRNIILASGSPRRKELLQLAGIPFDVYISNCNESYPEGLTPGQVCEHIAVNKAAAVRCKVKNDQIILAADTIVVLGGDIIGKPIDRREAINILEKLSGKTHSVITGVCILNGSQKIVFHQSTLVTFRPLSTEQIVYYIDHFKPYDKAGAYAIQEWIGAIAIERINGDYYNVVGLPINTIFDILNKF